MCLRRSLASRMWSFLRDAEAWSSKARESRLKLDTAQVEKLTTLHIKGYDKEQVGQYAAAVRARRPPEPYKGKGVRYVDEFVRKKEGKRGKK